MTETKKNNKNWIIVCAVIVVVVLALVLWAVFGKKEEKAEKEEKVYKVSVIEIGATGNDVELTYTGIVQPQETEQATFPTIGTVKHLYVKEGQEVKAGEVLAVLDDTDARRQLKNSENNLTIARTNLDSAIKQRDRAYEDYLDACGADDEKENLNDAIERRDEQEDKVNTLSSELVSAEAKQTQTKEEYDTARSELVSAQSEYTTKSTELEALKQSGASQERIDAKQEEVDAANEKVNSCQDTYNTKQSANTQAQIDYRAKQTELDAAQSTLTTYNEGVDSAQESYDKKLQEGADSSEAKAQKERYDTAEDSVTSSQASYDSSKNNYDSAAETLEDCVLKAKNDGYVLQVGVTEGGMANPIMPAVVLGSNQAVVSFGVSQGDIRDIYEGLAAKLTINGNPFDGYVSKVSLLPDETSRTYMTDIVINTENAEFYLGELATVKLNIGARQGIWLPLSVILNDGQDYVYVVEEGRAKRQNIVIEDVNNDIVLVSGLPEGSKVISEGMKLVSTGSPVNYDEQENAEQKTADSKAADSENEDSKTAGSEE